MARSEGVDRGRAPAIDDLPARLRRAVEGLSGTADLSSTLGHLLRVVGPESRVERLVVAADGGEPHELASYPAPVASLQAHGRIAALVHRVSERRDCIAEPLPDGRRALAAPEPARARYAVPVSGGGTTLAVLVGESVPDTALTALDEVALESIAALLGPLLLVRRQLEDVRELDRLRSDFIARVSHELRTPLTIITGFAGTLGAHEDTLSTEQRHAMLDRIVTASIRLEHLIEEVLSLASLDAGLAEPHPTVVPVGDVVDMAVHDRGGDGRVEVRGDGRLKVRTDPEVARVVLGALVENALHQGTAVTVEISEVADRVRVAVEDDGPGVPPELGPRVFERFVRGDDSSPGMGLGLAIARRMADTIGARLWFDDVPAGARFVVELPWMPDTDEAVAQSP